MSDETKQSKAYYARRARELYAETLALKEQLRKPKVAPFNPAVPGFRRGLAAEAYVKYRLMREGFEVYDPQALTEALDILVKGATKYHRCEVKARTNGTMIGLRSSRYDREVGKVVSRPYTQTDAIDFFLLVDLDREELFILPYAEAGTKHHITCTPDGYGWQYKDRFDLFT